MKREATQTIWKTVVFAGAMLGTPACKSKPAATTPTPATAKPAAPQGEGSASSGTTEPAADASAPDPSAGDPCNAPDSPDRPRGADDDGGGGIGRGFVLS